VSETDQYDECERTHGPCETPEECARMGCAREWNPKALEAFRRELDDHITKRAKNAARNRRRRAQRRIESRILKAAAEWGGEGDPPITLRLWVKELAAFKGENNGKNKT